MKRWYGFLTIAVLAAGMAASAMAADPPAWAYGFTSYAPPPPPNPNGRGGRGPQAPPDMTIRTVPGSTLQVPQAQIGGGAGAKGPADWFPQDHPMMPDVVAYGRQPDVRACSLCHYPNGKGRAENAGVAGLPITYFLQTLNDFKNDKRITSDLRKANTGIMTTIAKAMTDDEMKAAAQYFGSMKWTPWIKVVEAGGLFIALPGNEMEPINGRIIEVPVDGEQSEILRNPRSPFIVYTPKGSLKHGETLAKSANCTSCHGSDLRGLGPVPGIAGRSPSYMVRQMYDIQVGHRNGEWSALMKPVVEKMSNDDLRDVAAYAASQQP
jgi:cytochrome c553